MDDFIEDKSLLAKIESFCYWECLTREALETDWLPVCANVAP